MTKSYVSYWLAQSIKSLANSCVCSLMHVHAGGPRFNYRCRQGQPNLPAFQGRQIGSSLYVVGYCYRRLQYRGTLHVSVWHYRKLPWPVLSAAITRWSNSSQLPRRATITNTWQSGTLHYTHTLHRTHLRWEASTWMGDHQGRPPAPHSSVKKDDYGASTNEYRIMCSFHLGL